MAKSVVSELETIQALVPSLRRKVVDYIERCRLEDGGYFFARVVPSSGMDTYFAVKSLSILGVKPERPEAIIDFFLDQLGEKALSGITGIFAAAEVMNELGQMNDGFKSHARRRVMAFRNKTGGFGAMENIDVEVPSELEETYRAVAILKIIGADFDEAKVTRFVFSLLNPDGGYGREGHSTLASTFYATEVHRLLGVEPAMLAATRDYLRMVEDAWQTNFDNGRVQFIEHLFWLVRGLANLGDRTNIDDSIVRFVMGCHRPNGGFARTTTMGIPTLEYTYYAVSILREVSPYFVSAEIG